MLEDLYNLVAAPSEREAAVAELMAMDDHDLADMGLARDQVEAYVAEHIPE